MDDDTYQRLVAQADAAMRGDAAVDRSEDADWDEDLDQCLALMRTLNQCAFWRTDADPEDQAAVLRWIADARSLKRWSVKDMCRRYVEIINRVYTDTDSATMSRCVMLAKELAPRLGYERICGEVVS